VKPILLTVLDGWGIASDPDFDAQAKADIPYYRDLLKEYPNTILDCSGEAVGLPEGQMGNSEVGHLNLGAGRVVYQDYARINRSIKTGNFNRIPSLLEACNAAKGDRALHLLGLVSDGGVHSHISHLYALIDMAVSSGVQNIFIHAFMDGRDTPPSSGIDYMRQLESYVHDKPQARIATVSGRFWAMDRDNRWERVAKAYEAIVSGSGKRAYSGSEAIEVSYERRETDEFIKPTVIFNNSDPVGRIKDGDSVIFFNFRADRARELTKALTSDKFLSFDRGGRPKLDSFLTMTLYDETLPFPVAFPPVKLTNILGEVLSRHGLRQLRIAETEKYAHVTYFFNGGKETRFKGEERCLIPSPKDVPTYDLKPEMSASLVTDEVIKRLDKKLYDFILLNYANPDMVGHTGVMNAAIKACEAIDVSLKRICDKVMSLGGTAIITADHGNCEVMIHDGEPQTAHTLNPVPFILMKKGLRLREKGILADVAPTVLDLMKIEKPREMTGQSLII
jgi:2,3-bisphosphoglycerate-independent phosphoglycerate mutase